MYGNQQRDYCDMQSAIVPSFLNERCLIKYESRKHRAQNEIFLLIQWPNVL